MRRSFLSITNKRNTKFKIRRSILLAILTLIFVAFGGSSVSALDLNQESIEITDKSATTVVHDAGIGDLRITPNLEFNRLDDFISYKLVIKNNDGKKYRIVSITDDNSNEAIALTYSYPTEMDIKNKEIDFTVKYVKITNSPLKTINVVIKIVDEEDASEEIPIVIPNTGANTSFDTVSAVTVQSIIIYIVFAAICCAIYIIVRRKKMEKDKRVDLRVPKALLGFALLLGIIPVAVIASSFESIYFTVNLTEVKLNGPYVITFDTDEGGPSIPDQIVNNGDPIAKPSPDPERKGYTFEGWVDENGDPYDFDTPVTGPVKISADWKPITYTIAYDLAGGIAGTPANKTEYTIETPDFTLTNPTKEHYDFAGWTGTDLSGPTTTVKISQGSTENRSYTATWKEKEYTATFDTDGGTPAIANQTKKYNETFTKPADPEKLGYEFKGWFLDDTAYDFATKVTKNITLKAKWEAVGYVVTFNANGGTPTPAAQTVKYQETATKPAEDPTRTGYNFKGWQLNGADYDFATKVTDNITLIAKWEKKEYTVTFDANGGTPTPAAQTVKYQETATKPEDPTMTGHNFKGWQLNGADYDFATKVTDNITLVAKWEKKEYTVTFDANGGTPTPAAQTVKYQETATKPENPTKDDYRFFRWLDKNGNEYNFATPVTENITLTAEWTQLFVVSFDTGDGGSLVPAQQIANGGLATRPEDPEKTGYTFKGWQLNNADYDFATEVTGDITLVANWEIVNYTITIDLTGGTPGIPANPTSYTVVTPDITLTSPTKDHYDFAGWTSVSDSITTPTKTIEIKTGSTGNRDYKANWTEKEYTVTFDSNGGTSIQAQKVKYPQTATLPDPAPTRDGYTFKGWQLNNADYDFATEVTGDITLVAKWEIIEYTISYKGLEGAMVNPANTATYTIKSDAIILNDAMKSGYTFDGWTGEGITTPTKGLTIPSGSIGYRTYTANWTIITYNINYTGLEDATVDPANKTTYDVNTETFALTEPTKRGYTFTGWTSNSDGITAPTKSITIAKGSTGDRDYAANWVLTVFTITYDLDGGNVATANPTEYTMETETFEISNEPTKDGTYAFGMDKYEFIGWTGTELSGPTKPVTIVKGSVGDRSYKANYKHSFKVLFSPGDHGTITEFDRWVEENTAVGAFPTVTVNPGYRFVGWYNSLDSTQMIVDGTYKVTTAVGFTAKYEVIDYTISLDPNGGSYKGSTSAYTVGTYNIESPSPVTVWEPSATDLGPTQEGYRFTGWTGEGITTPTLDKVELTVSAETLGNKIYTANWVKQWMVTFESDGSVVTTEAVDDGATVNRPADPVKADYVFKGWKLGGADYNFNAPVTGDITLKAEWQVGKSTLSLDGKGMSTKMKQLADPTAGITNGYDKRDTKTKAFVRADRATYDDAVSKGLISDANNKISTGDSIAATYMWFDSSTGTMYYYTEAAKIYVNGSMDRMFAKYTNITDWSGLEDFDTSGATAMDRLFQDCPSFDDAALEYIKDWNTSNVRDMTFMFGANSSDNGNKITKLTALTNWDVSKVRSFYQAFKHATKLESLGELVDDPKNPGTQIYNGLGQWNVSSVGYESDTSILPSNDNYGFAQMFNGCTSLTDADAIVDWDINNAITSAVNAGKNRSWAFDGMLRNAPVRPTQPAFTSWAPGGSWSDTGTFNPNAAP